MSEKADTWMPLYVGDYLAVTPHLTTEQHGAYLLLLMACWKLNGLLPDDDDQLAAIARITPAVWRRHRLVIRPLFVSVAGGLTQKRVAAELEKARHLSAVRREAGRKGGRPTSPGPDGPQTQSKPKAIGSAKSKPGRTPSPSPVRKDDPHGSFLPDDGRARGGLDGRASPVEAGWGGPDEVWAAVVRHKGEAWARDVLGSTVWRDLPTRAVICRSGALDQEVRRYCTRLLAGLGINIVREDAA
jgi:uncharacterized protein YdaU (DUF1376 family)